MNVSAQDTTQKPDRGLNNHPHISQYNRIMSLQSYVTMPHDIYGITGIWGKCIKHI